MSQFQFRLMLTLPTHSLPYSHTIWLDDVEGLILGVVCVHAPQVGHQKRNTIFFFSKLDDVAEGVPARERVVVGADPNGHVGDGEKAMWIIWCERQEYIRTDD